jgi:tetratricopeptide (TPR) repeat protein
MLPTFYRARHAGQFWLLLLAATMVAEGQKKVACPDGEHIQIDIKQISIQYDASSFAGTLSSLSVLGARLEVKPTKLQEAAVATQQWDELLKGLVAGYNSCAITRQQYADGLTRIYPRLKEDGAELEEIRKAIAAGQKADAKRLQQLIDSFYANLRQFAQASGSEIVLERIAALSEQIAGGRQDILQQQKTDTEQILSKMDQLKEANKQAPLATPAQVGQQISELRKSLLVKADEAEAAYNQGYALLDRYRFAEAIPYLQQALADVPLSDFYLALGRAFRVLPNLSEAEKVLREGLKTSAGDAHEAQLANQLGLVLQDKGDLDGALLYTQRALKIDEKVYGTDHPEVARDTNNIGTILQAKGELDGALQFTRRALKIDEKVYGTDYPTVARDANNIGQILQAKGDLEEALQCTQRALKIDEKVYGLDNPTVAIFANNIGRILQDKGDLDGALQSTKQALKIDEKVYGTDSPTVARDANNVGGILEAKGDLDGALEYMQRALKIDEKVYGPDHPDVAIRANNIGQILQAKGDLDGALQSTQRALKIDEKVYGPDHPAVAREVNNIGTILLAKGDLDGALEYAQRALKIDEKVYGTDNPTVARDANNVGEILQSKGALDGALQYMQRALKILQNSYGPDNPTTKMVAGNVEQIRKAMHQ